MALKERKYPVLGRMFTETRQIFEMTFPVALDRFVDSSFWVVDLVMLGHLGKGNLASGSLAIAYFSLIWVFIHGAFVSQSRRYLKALESNDRLEVRLLSYGLLSSGVLYCLVGSGLLIVSPFIFGLFVSNSHVAGKAVQFCYLLVPSLWMIMVHRVIQICHSYHSLLLPSLICSFCGSIVNAIANYLLMYLIGLGFVGCSISTNCARLCSLVLLLNYSRQRREFRKVPVELYVVWISLLSSARKLCQLGDVVAKVAVVDELTFDESVTREELGADMDSDREAESVFPREKMVMVSKNSRSSKKLDRERGRKSRNKKRQNEANEQVESPMGSHLTRDGAEEDEELLRDELNERNHDSSAMRRPEAAEMNEDRRSFIKKKWKHFMRYPLTALRRRIFRNLIEGIQSGVEHGLELWLLDLSTLAVAPMGSVVICTQQLLATTTNVAMSTMPMAICSVSQRRMRFLLGSDQKDAAALHARLVMFYGFLTMGYAAVGVYFLCGFLMTTFTNDENVPERAIQLSVFVAVYQALAGIEFSAQSVLSGLGWSKKTFGLKFLSMWLCGLPTGLYLNYFARPTFGLTGVWIGLVTGMGLQAVVTLAGVFTTDWNREVAREKLRLKKEEDLELKENVLWNKELNMFPDDYDGSEGEKTAADLTRQSLLAHNVGFEGGGIEMSSLALDFNTGRKDQKNQAPRASKTSGPLGSLLAGLFVNPDAELEELEEEEDAMIELEEKRNAAEPETECLE